MRTRTLLAPLAAGIAAFLVVTVAVTEFALTWIEFSLFVGLPAGLLAGVAVAAGVYLGLAGNAPARRRRVALAVAAFGAVFLGILVVTAAVGVFSVLASLVVGVVAGGVAAAVTYALGGAPDAESAV